MRVAWFAMTVAALGAVPAAAAAHGEGGDAVTLLRSDYALPAGPDRDAADRWLLPDIGESYERREPPRLRWRGKKLKLRLPLG